jgi:ankyrin repeat protein
MSEALQALYEGNVEKAKELLRPDDELSIFEAAAFGRTERLSSILAEDPSQAAAFSDDGFTALHLAVFARQADAARVLIEHGADVNVQSTGPIARVPPLGTAAFVGSAPLARLLLDAGADVDGEGDGGFTALHAAAQSGNTELVRLLLEHGADASRRAADGTRAADLAGDEDVRGLLAS